jgi:hypothetical protein
MLNNSNLIIITTTLSHNVVSEKRRTNLINEFSKYNISIIFNHGVLKDTFTNKSFRVSKNSCVG